MSKINEVITVREDLETVRKAVRRAGSKLQSLIEEGDSFEIKETIQRTLFSATLPTTVKITLGMGDLGEGTKITFLASNMGIGPIQDKAATARLGAVKATVMDELEAGANAGKNSEADNLEALLKLKQLLDAGAISEDEYNQKKKQLLGL